MLLGPSFLVDDLVDDFSHHFLRLIVTFFEVVSFDSLCVSVNLSLRQSITVCNSCFVKSGKCSLLSSWFSLASISSVLQLFCSASSSSASRPSFVENFHFVVFFVPFMFFFGAEVAVEFREGVRHAFSLCLKNTSFSFLMCDMRNFFFS